VGDSPGKSSPPNVREVCETVCAGSHSLTPLECAIVHGKDTTECLAGIDSLGQAPRLVRPGQVRSQVCAL